MKFNFLIISIVALSLGSCTSFRPLAFTSNKQVSASPAAPAKARFIDNISVTPQAAAVDKTEFKSNTSPALMARTSARDEQLVREELKKINTNITDAKSMIETASPVQLKYSILLNTEVENLPQRTLLEAVDDWYGVRYRTGGNTHSGVDCSGFTCAVYTAAYGFALPRVSRDQYRMSRKISTTELKEGDLLFFDTRGGGGITHVGVYLGNNRFIHATVSKGVMVSDLFEKYYLTRFVGAGRIDEKDAATATGTE
ncbi:MAG: C40 family peptidase [Chitinophagaceae bacterium]|nr:C40 family peptidase [Chitinophagaceae bacterium]